MRPTARGPTDHADAAETVRNGVKDLDREASRSYAERGGVARIELLEIRNGSRITTDMAAVDPNASTLAADVDRTRGFVLDVDPGSLVETNASGAVDNAFHVELNDSTGGTHQVYVYNGTDGNVTVAVGDNSGEPTVWCETPPDGRDRVAVDLTGERLGGRSCPGIWPTALVAPDDAYDITLMSANAAAGEAAATVRAVSQGTLSPPTSRGRQPAVYEATIGLRYRTAELRFETDVRSSRVSPMRERRGSGRKRLLSDERGVSVTVGYVLTLAIGAVLLSGVVIGVGGVVDSQTDRAVRGDLSVLGQTTAANVESADRLARAAAADPIGRTRAGATNASVSVAVDLPRPSRGDSLPDHGR